MDVIGRGSICPAPLTAAGATASALEAACRPKLTEAPVLTNNSGSRMLKNRRSSPFMRSLSRVFYVLQRGATKLTPCLSVLSQNERTPARAVSTGRSETWKLLPWLRSSVALASAAARCRAGSCCTELTATLCQKGTPGCHRSRPPPLPEGQPLGVPQGQT